MFNGKKDETPLNPSDPPPPADVKINRVCGVRDIGGERQSLIQYKGEEDPEWELEADCALTCNGLILRRKQNQEDRSMYIFISEIPGSVLRHMLTLS